MVLCLSFFIFLLGSCVGSFLNVLIYRLPRRISIVTPGSHCPDCSHPIAFYDNIPLLSWILLKRRCRHCHQPIPATYPLVELLTALTFTGIFLAYMVFGLRENMPFLIDGPQLADWVILALYLWLISALLAASAVDFRLSVIPLPITTITAIVAVAVHGLFPHPLLTRISTSTAALAAGACLGLLISAMLLRVGVFRPTFQVFGPTGLARLPRRRKRRKSQPSFADSATPDSPAQPPETFNARVEILHEILYLLPPTLLAIITCLIVLADTTPARALGSFLANPIVGRLSASLFGLLIGGAVVWVTRILGTLAFGREAMGLGDVHLMAAAGAVLGWIAPVLAFFIAPFFGLIAVIFSAARHRAGELPYGPWLSLGLLTAMVFQDKIWSYIGPGLQNLWQLLVAA